MGRTKLTDELNRVEHARLTFRCAAEDLVDVVAKQNGLRPDDALAYEMAGFAYMYWLYQEVQSMNEGDAESQGRGYTREEFPDFISRVLKP